MSLLKEKDRQQLIKEFETLQQPVKLVVFTQELECQFCVETRMIAEEVAALSDKITLEIYDFVTHKEIAEQYKIDKIPAMVVMQGGDSPKDFGIRYFGIPSGYEFTTLIQGILMVSSGESGLSAETKAYAAAVTEPLHLQVFVTPTCPYCPGAVHLAHQLAMENELIRGDMVEAVEFPHLSMKYRVQGVPRTVINETEHLEGAAPESLFLAKLKSVVAA
ncbi:MAG TPA: thioredoxin family protein [Anaerolineae bacterium]|nr:thioredoxin family protein [Anaerolineae bacterium]HMR65646.1 thioredoxin family protein [Anaerolineae bacterium]